MAEMEMVRVCDVQGCRKLADGECARCGKDSCQGHLDMQRLSLQLSAVHFEKTAFDAAHAAPTPDETSLALDLVCLCRECYLHIKDGRYEKERGDFNKRVADVVERAGAELRQIVRAQWSETALTRSRET